MTKDEMIENMAELMCDQCENINCIEEHPCDEVVDQATLLYDAGYRLINGDDYVSIEWHNEQIAHAEQEIERLRNEKWDAQDDLDCYHSEMKNSIKQAKIEVLEMVRQQLADNGALTVKSAITIDELIEEVKAE